MKTTQTDILVIGAGQAGLACAYYLSKAKAKYLLVEGNKRVGDSWRNRYDSLHLLTPDSENSLPEFLLHGNANTYATKDVFANYLEKYSTHFSFPIHLNTTITRLEKNQNYYVAFSKSRKYIARNIIIATGAFQKPYIPNFAKNISKKTFQIHSKDYKNAKQLPVGKVLVVGAGNSGAQIAVELAKTHSVSISSRRKLITNNSLDFLYQIAAIFLNGKIIRKLVDIFGVRKVYVKGIEELLKSKKVVYKAELINVKSGKFNFKDHSFDLFDIVIWSTGFVFDFSWIKIKSTELKNVSGLYFIYPERDYGFIRDLPAKAKLTVDAVLKNI